MKIELAVAKINKYAASESGDTLEIVERPHGGLSAVLVDGQSSGRGAKAVSNLVARKAIALLAEGVRDGAAARAAHDYLRTLRRGQVSATLNIISVDLLSQSLVISRNNPCPVVLADAADVRLLDEPSAPIGIHDRTKPHITEVTLTAPLVILAFTDGFWHLHERDGGRTLDVSGRVRAFLTEPAPSAQVLADSLLAQALALVAQHPTDDISLMVLAILPVDQHDGIRRLNMTFPVTPAMRARRGL